MTAPEVVIEIVKANPGIEFLSFHVYTPHEGIKESSSPPSLSRLLYHDPSRGGRMIKVKRSEIVAGNLGGILPLFKEDAVGVLSKVRSASRYGFGKQNFHIPLMDFSCEDSPENLEKVKEFLSEAGQKRGVILLSGRSYHYYGVDLMSEKEWLNFLGKCLLFTGFTDERYIGHRLLDRCGILRISARGGLHSKVPTVVSIL
jgi:hypothetical protein